MAKILLIEDEQELREIVAFNVENAGHELVAAADGNEGLLVLDEFLPDLILLDIMLPGLKGDQFLKLIRAQPASAQIPVIIVSAKSSEEDIVSMLEAGADDYLTKPFSMRILLAKIAIILKRQRGAQVDGVVSYADISVNEVSHEVFVKQSEVVLTHKEFELLLLLIKNPRRVFTRNQLLSTIWGYDADVYSRTVDSHISTLRKKLGDAGKYIRSIPKIGYRVE